MDKILNQTTKSLSCSGPPTLRWSRWSWWWASAWWWTPPPSARADPAKSKELYLGYYPTDLITRTKIDEVNVHSHNLTPNFRIKPNPKYLKLNMDKFNRSRHGTHQLYSEKGILTPIISVRIYKTLQRSTLFYAIEFCDWDVDQMRWPRSWVYRPGAHPTQTGFSYFDYFTPRCG